MSEGYASILLVNVVVFLSASQIFGDPFVLIVLGFMSGFLLSSLAATPTTEATAGRPLQGVPYTVRR